LKCGRAQLCRSLSLLLRLQHGRPS
jgi:hypothetical protein